MNSSESAIERLKIDRTKRRSASPIKPTLVFIGVSVLLVTAIAFYYFQHTDQLLSVPAPTQPVDIQAKAETKQPVEESTEQKILDASGHIVARRVATVSSRVTGKLEELHIEEGQHVKQEQILAEVDDVQANLAYQRAKANLLAVQANYQELTVLKRHDERRLARQKTLNKSQLVSEQLTEDSEARIAQLSAQINSAKALVALHENNVALAKYELEQHQIRAPFDGVVISKNAQVGELISAGNSGGSIRTGVGTIVDMSSLEIEVEVSESYINRVEAGQQVIAKLDAYPEWDIPSEVIAIIPTADRQKASIKVRIKLLAIDDRVLPDMGVRVSFISTQSEQAFLAANKQALGELR